MNAIHTEYGDVEIKDLSHDMLKELQKRLPYGFWPFNEEFQGARYGFVVRCGADEIPLLKQQPVECDKERAMLLINVHFVGILSAYCKMAKDGIDGIYYATPYLKDKGEAGWESGVAHFIFPGEQTPVPDSPVLTSYDGAVGKGGTALLVRFMEHFKEIFDDKFRIDYIGIDVRTRSQIGNLVSGFMLMGKNIIYHGTLHGDDPRFGVLAKNGVTSIVHAPSCPMTISPDQLKMAKGESK
ncbi:MAG: hypothetical protein IJ584_01250 [Bacteroidales bacterium]|nr:hypothetical protein [Bacteroidales bacterium]